MTSWLRRLLSGRDEWSDEEEQQAAELHEEEASGYGHSYDHDPAYAAAVDKAESKSQYGASQYGEFKSGESYQAEAVDDAAQPESGESKEYRVTVSPSPEAQPAPQPRSKSVSFTEATPLLYAQGVSVHQHQHHLPIPIDAQHYMQQQSLPSAPPAEDAHSHAVNRKRARSPSQLLWPYSFSAPPPRALYPLRRASPLSLARMLEAKRASYYGSNAKAMRRLQRIRHMESLPWWRALFHSTDGEAPWPVGRYCGMPHLFSLLITIFILIALCVYFTSPDTSIAHMLHGESSAHAAHEHAHAHTTPAAAPSSNHHDQQLFSRGWDPLELSGKLRTPRHYTSNLYHDDESESDADEITQVGSAPPPPPSPPPAIGGLRLADTSSSPDSGLKRRASGKLTYADELQLRETIKQLKEVKNK